MNNGLSFDRKYAYIIPGIVNKTKKTNKSKKK